jgi:exopolyphosphatase/pppGpp-phosphohydrolase
LTQMSEKAEALIKEHSIADDAADILRRIVEEVEDNPTVISPEKFASLSMKQILQTTIEGFGDNTENMLAKIALLSDLVGDDDDFSEFMIRYTHWAVESMLSLYELGALACFASPSQSFQETIDWILEFPEDAPYEGIEDKMKALKERARTVRKLNGELLQEAQRLGKIPPEQADDIGFGFA